jgi:hypothetical protein
MSFVATINNEGTLLLGDNNRTFGLLVLPEKKCVLLCCAVLWYYPRSRLPDVAGICGAEMDGWRSLLSGVVAAMTRTVHQTGGRE